MRHRSPPAAALAPLAVVVALAGCSGGTADPPPPVPEVPAASTPASTPVPGGPSPATSSLPTLPVEQCLTSTWRLVRFVGASGQTYGTGEGGDVSVRFGDGGYALVGAGKRPVTVTLAGRTAALTVDGDATGTFAAKDGRADFVQRSASGTARLEAGGESKRLPMGQVTGVVGLRGEGQVACTADAMTITLPAVRLELGRD